MKKILALVLALALVFTCFVGCGQDEQVEYPTRSIKIIVPFAAGGSADLQTRIVADKMEEILGQTVVVENQPGGSGAVGVNACLAEEADGYTLVTITNGPSTVAPILSDTGYTTEEITQIGLFSDVGNFICVSKKLGIDNWDALVEYAKNSDKPLTYGTSSAGAYANIAFQNAIRSQGLEDYFQIVPNSDGGRAAATECAGGSTDLVLTVPIELQTLIDSGDLIPVLWVAGQRNNDYPDVSCVKELGMTSPSDNGGTFTGLACSSEVDPEIIAILEAAVKQIIEDEDTVAQFADLGMTAVFEDAATFRARVLSDYESNTAALKAIGLIS
ncbi:MAG: tripartite tricarboxylate transporter substrate binding protein [Anaerovoracaceae bacterium]